MYGSNLRLRLVDCRESSVAQAVHRKCPHVRPQINAALFASRKGASHRPKVPKADKSG